MAITYVSPAKKQLRDFRSSVKFTADEHARITEYQRITGITIMELCRRAVAAYLDQHAEKAAE